jgi:hypothetical protein
LNRLLKKEDGKISLVPWEEKAFFKTLAKVCQKIGKGKLDKLKIKGF